MANSTSMRAVTITGHGGPEVLQLVDCAVPRPGPDEVLLRVIAASVNRPDISYRKGIYDPPPGASPIPGLDVAGEVTRVGDRVTRWRPGDRVCALVNGGGYAEYCAVPAGQCLPIPDGLDAVRAAALPEAFFTAWVNLFEPDLGRLGHGEHVLIQGGASGVGIAAIQLAIRLRNALVVVTAGQLDKRNFCCELGATAAIDYREGDWPRLARAAVADAGFDLILDGQGAPYLDAHQKLLRTGGRLVLIATHLGTIHPVDLRDLMRRRLTLTGSTLRPRTAAFKARIARDLEQHVWPMLIDGRIRMPVIRTFDLADVADSHHFLEGGGGLGKVVLRVAAD